MILTYYAGSGPYQNPQPSPLAEKASSEDIWKVLISAGILALGRSVLAKTGQII
ncbi:MAG TPA: hypothetical protein VF173_19000 [Thermoanaerobaculia bacterium]|nr:hypothetical protein [Thermoanaerobaculia bacterium]